MNTEFNFNTLTRAQIVISLNEWMRRYTENPSEFSHEWEVVAKFLEEDSQGVEPSYGKIGAEFLFDIAMKFANE